jgi:hypothetical protein
MAPLGAPSFSNISWNKGEMVDLHNITENRLVYKKNYRYNKIDIVKNVRKIVIRLNGLI